ncbi:MAG: hypothetical protein AAGE52_18300 [Myxococcota bacterium]
MKRRPQGWLERFQASLEGDPSPALEAWRWALEGEDPCDARAIEAAWDLVTLHASAEANKLNHAMHILDDELQRTLLPALVVAGARVTEVGAFQVFARDGKRWIPRDLAFVPGRVPLDPQLKLECVVEEGRSVIDFRLWYEHKAYRREGDDMVEAAAETRMAVLLSRPERRHQDVIDDRARDLELQNEGYLIVRYDRSEVWRDPLGSAVDALRTLTETARFDAEARLRET